MKGIPEIPSDYVTVSEWKKVNGDPRFVYSAIRSRKISHYRKGGTIYVNPEEISGLVTFTPAATA
jgi:hypothetical protein